MVKIVWTSAHLNISLPDFKKRKNRFLFQFWAKKCSSNFLFEFKLDVSLFLFHYYPTKDIFSLSGFFIMGTKPSWACCHLRHLRLSALRLGRNSSSGRVQLTLGWMFWVFLLFYSYHGNFEQYSAWDALDLFPMPFLYTGPLKLWRAGGCIAQRKHSCFPLSISEFKSWLFSLYCLVGDSIEIIPI